MKIQKIFFIVFAISALMSIIACKTNKVTSEKNSVETQVKESEMIESVEEQIEISPTQSTYSSGLLLENMDKSVKPGNNFQMYVNGKWLDKTEIPSDKARYGIFTILRDHSQDNVKEIIESSAEKGENGSKDEQKVGGLYSSFMDMDTRNKLGVEPLNDDFAKIDALTNHNDLIKFFAYANSAGYNVPLSLFVYSDLKDPNYYALYCWQGGLGLPDKEYYFKEDSTSVALRDQYVMHIRKMMLLGDIENDMVSATKAANSIMDLETTIAQQHMKKEDTRDMVALYNEFPVDSLDVLMPDFAWNEYFQEAKVTNIKKLIVPQIDYTKSLNDIIFKTDLDTWKTYLKWSILNRSATRLTTAIGDQNFEFYGKAMRGTTEQIPEWRRAVGLVDSHLGEVIGKVYVQRHFPPEAKERMLILVNNLLKAYEVSIKELDWMGEETKKQALDKLSKFTPKIGYPDKWKEYNSEIKADDLFGNVQRSNQEQYKKDIEKLSKPVDRSEWGMNPQTVNAYYNPPLNEIVFPAAILQPPFFDLNADDAVNYGAIGGVIGHEIGHGFDDQGSTFDGDGVLRNWWTDQDREEFKKRTNALIDQYNSFKVFDDLNVNGEFTLGENIGDLGGLTIALKAYEMSLDGKEAPVMDGYNGIQRVFIGWAQAWRDKSREEALRMQVGTDPHSPALFRVNGVVRNIPAFYEAFEIEEGDDLYLPPDQRVKIW